MLRSLYFARVYSGDPGTLVGSLTEGADDFLSVDLRVNTLDVDEADALQKALAEFVAEKRRQQDGQAAA